MEGLSPENALKVDFRSLCCKTFHVAFSLLMKVEGQIQNHYYLALDISRWEEWR